MEMNDKYFEIKRNDILASNLIAEIISAQIQVALEKEYDRGWKECMEYYWSKREIDMDKLIEDKDPYAG